MTTKAPDPYEMLELARDLEKKVDALIEENVILRRRCARLRDVATAAATDLSESHETRSTVGEEFAEEQWMRCERTDAAVERLKVEDLGPLPPRRS